MSSSRFHTINTLCIHTLQLTTAHAFIEITTLHNREIPEHLHEWIIVSATLPDSRIKIIYILHTDTEVILLIIKWWQQRGKAPMPDFNQQGYSSKAKKLKGKYRLKDQESVKRRYLKNIEIERKNKSLQDHLIIENYMEKETLQHNILPEHPALVMFVHQPRHRLINCCYQQPTEHLRHHPRYILVKAEC